ncbi:MAG: hypothetical protein ACUVXF_06660 [Desulfobaccales bacterium]
MSKLAQQRKRKALKSALFYGALTTALYLAVFLNDDVVMTYFTKGGIYAILPVFTAFAFSFAHGAFTGSFWSALGIEASKKATRVEMPATKPAERVRPHPRLRLSA